MKRTRGFPRFPTAAQAGKGPKAFPRLCLKVRPKSRCLHGTTSVGRVGVRLEKSVRGMPGQENDVKTARDEGIESRAKATPKLPLANGHLEDQHDLRSRTSDTVGVKVAALNSRAKPGGVGSRRAPADLAGQGVRPDAQGTQAQRALHAGDVRGVWRE
jgi:hypothetical protein